MAMIEDSTFFRIKTLKEWNLQRNAQTVDLTTKMLKPALPVRKSSRAGRTKNFAVPRANKSITGCTRNRIL